jgi:hypothetical protein
VSASPSVLVIAVATAIPKSGLLVRLRNIDHIIPEALGGLTEEDNRWLACSLCNNHKGVRLRRSILKPARSCDSSIRDVRFGASTLPGRRQVIGLSE